MYEQILYSVADPVATITLNRPERLNAWTDRMGAEVRHAVARAEADKSVVGIVITGAGRGFCAGADLKGLQAITVGERGATQDATLAAEPGDPKMGEGFRKHYSYLLSVRKPVIAAINGHAVGIGLTIAMQCDIRLVAREAKLAFAHVRRGVVPDAHSHWTVPRAIGFARTAELFLTGRHVGGDEAAAIGLVSRALPAPEVLPAARAMAREIATQCAPLSVALSKQLLWESRGLSRDEVGARETALHHVVMGRADALEGVMSFLERRPPQWTLRVPRDWPDD